MEHEAEERLAWISSKLGEVPREEVGETLLSMLDELWKLRPLAEEGKEKSLNMLRAKGHHNRGVKPSALRNTQRNMELWTVVAVSKQRTWESAARF